MNTLEQSVGDISVGIEMLQSKGICADQVRRLIESTLILARSAGVSKKIALKPFVIHIDFATSVWNQLENRKKSQKSGKGSGFERDVCSKLSLWWTDGRRDDVFWRSAGSGARATTRSKRGRQTVNQHGDITAVDPVGASLTDLFSIEIKRGYNVSTVHDLLDRSLSAAELDYERWIVNAMRDCRSAGAAGWLLIAKRDRHEAMIWMEALTMGLFDQIGVDLQIPPCCTLTTRIRNPKIQTTIFGMTLENFLMNVKPQAIMELGRIV